MNVPSKQYCDVITQQDSWKKNLWSTSYIVATFGTHRSTWYEVTEAEIFVEKEAEKALLCTQKKILTKKEFCENASTTGLPRWRGTLLLPHRFFFQSSWRSEHLIVRVSRWEVTLALSAIVTSLWDGRDFLPSAELRDLSKEKLLSCLNTCFLMIDANLQKLNINFY